MYSYIECILRNSSLNSDYRQIPVKGESYILNRVILYLLDLHIQRMIRIAARSLPRHGTHRCIRPSPVLFYSQPRHITRAMSFHLPAIKPPLSTALPSDSYQLLPIGEKTGPTEDALFNQEVEDIKQWWASPRYEGIMRPYSAEDVVSKRGTLQQTYPSSLMARKLFNLLKEKATAGEPVHTSEKIRENRLLNMRADVSAVGAIDPVQMTQQAANQEVLYISGWACSSVLTSTNEVSPDFGDYPYNTVPNQVQRLFKAQQLHDRKHWDARRKMSKDERTKTPYIDYMRPIVADGDTG